MAGLDEVQLQIIIKYNTCTKETFVDLHFYLF